MRCLYLSCHLSVFQYTRYTTSSSNCGVINGLISILQEGKEFVLKQIAAGVGAFVSVLADEVDALRELFQKDIDENEDEDEDIEEVA